jgi:hypothetical protein
MARIDVRSFIRATPERVWEVVSDLERHGDWMVDVRMLEVISEAKSGIGVVVDVRSELFGLPLLRDVMEVVTWRPPRELAVLHRGQFSGAGRFLLEPVRGGTVLVWQEDVDPPLGLLGELAFALVVGPYLRRVFSRSMDKLRLLAEAEEAKPAPAESRPPPRHARAARRPGR